HRSENAPMPTDEFRPQPPGTLRELGGVHHPNRDRLTVADQVVLYLLDRMAEGVAVVEHFAADAGLCRQRLSQVGRHDRGLNLDRAFHKLTTLWPALAGGGRRILLHQVEDHRVGDEARLDHFGQPTHVLRRRECREQIQITEDTCGWMEDADKVLSLSGIDRCLAADGGVYHSEQRRRNMDDPNAAQPGARHEPRDVADPTAADT